MVGGESGALASRRLAGERALREGRSSRDAGFWLECPCPTRLSVAGDPSARAAQPTMHWPVIPSRPTPRAARLRELSVRLPRDETEACVPATRATPHPPSAPSPLCGGEKALGVCSSRAEVFIARVFQSRGGHRPDEGTMQPPISLHSAPANIGSFSTLGMTATSSRICAASEEAPGWQHRRSASDCGVAAAEGAVHCPSGVSASNSRAAWVWTAVPGTRPSGRGSSRCTRARGPARGCS